jgi:transcriptional regulator with GAF, ATPase, and Fis domain
MSTELAIGQLTLELVRSVGQGASSDVWLARDTATGANVSLKVGRDAGQRGRLADEAERLLFVDSPWLSRVLGVGLTPRDGLSDAAADCPIHGSLPYVALEWFEGDTLRSRLGHVDDPERLALTVARDVARALADLHASGAAHGDVKPENIVVGPNTTSGRAARLIDLGLGEAADERMVRGGTPRYLAPEVTAMDARSDARARDLYALGLVLVEIVSEDVRVSAEPALTAAQSDLPAAVAHIARPLLSPAAGGRPSAAWVRDQALALLGEVEDEPTRRERRRRAVRRAYLAARRRDISRAAQCAKPSLEVAGEPGIWLEQALASARSAAALRGRSAAHAEVSLGELDAHGRSGLLMALVGPAAAAWPALTLRSDHELVERLLVVVERVEPDAISYAMLEDGPDTVGSGSEPQSPLELALALERGAVSAPTLLRAESAVQQDPSLVALGLVLARRLRLSGQTGRALSVLSQLDTPRARAELAEALRRTGDTERAETALRPLTQGGALDADVRERAVATLARIALERRGPDEALAVLAGTAQSAAVLEVRALAELYRGDRAAAARSIERARLYAEDDEERARIEAVSGMEAHAAGDAERELAAFQRAAELASRAGAVLEEATYLTGVAAAATESGSFGEALSASRRATLLFEHLGRPLEAARAVQARAQVYARAGALAEAKQCALEAVERARAACDQRCRAYAHLVLADVLPEQDREGAEHAERASHLLGVADGGDALRVGARLIVRDRAVARDALDQAARDTSSPIDARLEWWTARARVMLRGTSRERPDLLLSELVALAAVRVSPVLLGPASAAGAELAARAGDGQTARRLMEAGGAAARSLLSKCPSELRIAVESLAWMRLLQAPREDSVSPEQLANVEALVRVLGRRDRLRPLLDQVLDALVLWTGVERGLLLLRAPGGKLVVRAARNLAKNDLGSAQLELSQSLAQRALELREPVVAVDAAGDLPALHASVHALKLRSVLAVPLMAHGEALGVVYLDDRVRRGAFGTRELAWVRLVATLASVAIADARDQVSLRRAARRAERAEAKLSGELARREAELDVAERELARRTARETRFDYRSVVGSSEPLRRMLGLVDRVTASDVPVLVLGESGSGKELVARAIHENGARSKRPFVTENCGAIPEGLLESELFGHVRGAFTGASRPRAGLFEVADGGTLFLDEIAEMSLPMQTKLLRVLEDGEVRPVGAESVRRVDVRVIAATHRDLEALANVGKFRRDLYYRLNVIRIDIPPLRERASDIALLVRHFIEKHAQQRRVRVTKPALDLLMRSPWPGNVRQLENEIRRALVLADDTIDASHLSPDLLAPKAAGSAGETGLNLRTRVDALERELVMLALERTAGNQTRAAELLGLSRFGLQKMMKRLGIELSFESAVGSG